MKPWLKFHALFFMLCCVCFTPLATAQTKRFDLDASAKLVRLSDPNMAPDGKSIVVVVARANYEENRWENELVLVDVATGAQRALTSGRHDVTQPRWSPSGDRLAFITNDPTRGNPVTFITLDGGDSRISSDTARLVESLAAANPAPAGKPLSAGQLRRAQLQQLPGNRRKMRF